MKMYDTCGSFKRLKTVIPVWLKMMIFLKTQNYN